MPNRRQGTFPPRTDGGPERRQNMRRDDDVETHEIAETATSGTWEIIRDAKREWRARFIAALIGVAVSLPSLALGMRFVGPKQDIEAANKRIDANVTHIAANDRTLDSLTAVLRDMRSDIATATRLGCLNSSAKVAKAAGCP
jgi:hypothetical protein